MIEVLVFPDVVATAIDYLADAFADRGDTTTEFGSRIVDAEKFVVLTLGDTEIYGVVLQRSVIHVECWVDDGPLSHENAHDLAQLTRGLLGAMAGTQQPRGTVYRVTDEGARGTSDLPDSITGKFRYPFDVAITMRGYAT